MQKKPHRWSTVLPSHSLWGNWVHRRALTFPRFLNLSGDTEFPLYCMSFIMPHFLCTAVEYLVTFQNNHFRKLAVSYQVKYILILKLSNSASRNLPRGIENIMAWKKNVHRSCIHNSPDWKKYPCPITDKWIRKLCYIYTMAQWLLLWIFWPNSPEAARRRKEGSALWDYHREPLCSWLLYFISSVHSRFLW